MQASFVPGSPALSVPGPVFGDQEGQVVGQFMVGFPVQIRQYPVQRVVRCPSGQRAEDPGEVMN